MDLLAGKKGIDEKEAGSNEDGKSFFWVEHSEAKVEENRSLNFLIIVKLVVSFITHMSLLK